MRKINNERFLKTFAASASIGATPDGGLYRLTLSQEDKEMRDLFVSWLQEEKLDVRIDDFGNIYGRKDGKDNTLSPVVLGSHLDTQPYGGKYDGILGVLAALEVIRTLNEENVTTLRPIEIVNFTNEEGARFQPPLLGSGGATNVFSKDFVYDTSDKNGIRFEEALKEIGYQGEANNRITEAKYFMELHIEQGPVLEERKKEVGIVQGIQGMTWLKVTVTGEADHAGPTPMKGRKDALAASAAMLVAMREYAESVDDMTITVGQLDLKPNVVNVIPSQVEFSIDIRHVENKVREDGLKEIEEIIEKIAKQDGVNFQIETTWTVETITFSDEILERLDEGVSQLGYKAERLYSGANHDSKQMHQITETGMIFVPSINGKSHHESEFTPDEDLIKGTNLLLYATEALANETE